MCSTDNIVWNTAIATGAIRSNTHTHTTHTIPGLALLHSTHRAVLLNPFVNRVLIVILFLFTSLLASLCLSPLLSDYTTGAGKASADAVAWWQKIATKYKGKSHVLYEIANEPNGVTWNTVKAYVRVRVRVRVRIRLTWNTVKSYVTLIGCFNGVIRG